jgi:hypothetical protein
MYVTMFTSYSVLLVEPEVLNGWAQLAWPFVVLVVIGVLIFILRPVLTQGRSQVHIKAMGFEFLVAPPTGVREPGGQPRESAVLPEPFARQADLDALPFDYFFLNHTSFLRPEKQAEFRSRTGVPRDHYDIRIIVDSYYKDAHKRIDRVEYLLNPAYPEPLRLRRNRNEKFLLKELANGESVVIARVYLHEKPDEPIFLQRYIDLWHEGPRLNLTTSS